MSSKVLGIPLPDVSPSMCAFCLLMGLVPGLIYAWKATPRTFIYCVVFCSLSSFMLAYHVHEKAIMTAIIPLTMSLQTVNDKRLFVRISALGLVGLFPLLFRPIELSFKLLSYSAYIAFAYRLLGNPPLSALDCLGLGTLALAISFLEFLHPLFLHPRMEFLPLLLLSVSCAVGLIACWLSLRAVMRLSVGKGRAVP